MTQLMSDVHRALVAAGVATGAGEEVVVVDLGLVRAAMLTRGEIGASGSTSALGRLGLHWFEGFSVAAHDGNGVS